MRRASVRSSCSSSAPEPRRRARREVLHDNVGARHQRIENASRALVLDVERQAFLRAVAPDEMRGETLDPRIVGAREIANARPLDLDDARAEVGELARAEGRGDGVLKRDDGRAGKRTGAFRCG